ncbi:hypothetical protein I3760_15G056800 [Carya illinoinensis]|uniref:EF-hand domain-containing protein n=1 Tax=Carya illinoinensis TaxID=32201 RepID=A0A922ABR3_CARIL|nr:hypothetical protein I3760_15G056800 [Carya illinoinensis]KAG6674702.1 hypothetical protein I3842_15G057500 [Carya illinoinensis]
MGRATAANGKTDHTGTVPYTRTELMDVFNRCDKNGDGKLSRNELQAAFEVLGSKSPWCRAIWEHLRADKNRDGFIDKQEMEKLIDRVEKHGYLK